MSFVGCSSSNKQRHLELQKFVRQGDFKKGLELAKSKSFYSDEESKLLKLMELGMLNSLSGNYFQALQQFDEAKELSDKLFTVSISKKVVSSITNDNYDNYYGEKYERSLLRYYQALTHYRLYRVGEYESYEVESLDDKGKVLSKKVIEKKVLTEKERRFHLMAARSVLIEWNSLLDNYKSMSHGEATYKDDLLAKTFGAFIHEQFGTSEDRQIAKNLYKAAKKLLMQNYSMYKVYNLKNASFLDDFKKLPKLPIAEVEKNYIDKTNYYKGLEAFLDGRIKNLSAKQKDNVFIILNEGFVAPKVAKKIDIPLPIVVLPSGVKDKDDFLSFTLKVLNVGVGTKPSIAFELPAIANSPEPHPIEIIFKDSKGIEVAKTTPTLLNPISDIARKTLSDEETSVMAKTSARVIAKHVAALGTAYFLYQSQAKSSKDLGLFLAGASYAVANKGIEASEHADLRFWATLPSDYRVSSLRLPEGNYSVFIRSNGLDTSKGTLSVSKTDSSFLELRSDL